MSGLIRVASLSRQIDTTDISRRLARRLANEAALSSFDEPRGIRHRQQPQLLHAWIHFLSQWKWDWFATLTFRFDDNSSRSFKTRVRLPLIHPERANKVFRLWVSKINRALYGPRWAKHGDGVWWVRAEEFQRRGTLHYHALLGGVSELRRLTWMDEWEKLAGYARIEPRPGVAPDSSPRRLGGRPGDRPGNGPQPFPRTFRQAVPQAVPKQFPKASPKPSLPFVATEEH